MIPLVPMYTLGHTFVPARCMRGDCATTAMRPSLSLLVKHGHMEAVAYSQNAVFDAAVQFAHTEGIVPAPESAHAVRGDRRGDRGARCAGEERVILFNLSGHGAFDMQAYDDYLNGRLPEVEYRRRTWRRRWRACPTCRSPEVRRALDRLASNVRGERPNSSEASFAISGDDRVTDGVEVETVALPDQITRLPSRK